MLNLCVYTHLLPTVGPSLDSSGVNIVDAILVYGQTKTAFGWPEHSSSESSSVTIKSPPVSSTGAEDGEVEEEEAGESITAASLRPLSHLGR